MSDAAPTDQTAAARSEPDQSGQRNALVELASHVRRLAAAARSLDSRWFAGRYQNYLPNDGGHLLREIELIQLVIDGATEALSTVASPDASLEPLRDALVRAELATLPQGVPRPAPVAPTLAALTGQAIRLADRVRAVVSLAEEADLARNEAEAATAEVVASRSSEAVNPQLAAALAASQEELRALSHQSATRAEVDAAVIARLTRRVEELEESLASEQEIRRGEIAEARSLAFEIERMIATDPEAVANDELDIALGVLRDCLRLQDDDGPTQGGVTAAAEDALATWGRLLAARSSPELASENEDQRQRIKALEAENQRLHAEIERVSAEAERDIEAARNELSTIADQAETEMAVGASAARSWQREKAELLALVRQAREAVIEAKRSVTRGS